PLSDRPSRSFFGRAPRRPRAGTGSRSARTRGSRGAPARREPAVRVLCNAAMRTGPRAIRRQGARLVCPPPRACPMIDLHYWPTPSGHKITLMLEELAEAGAGLEYAVRPVNSGQGDQFRAGFLATSPTNDMRPIVGHAPADGGAPLSVFESGAILLYLAGKTGRFLPTGLRERPVELEWLFCQVAG